MPSIETAEKTITSTSPARETDLREGPKKENPENKKEEKEEKEEKEKKKEPEKNKIKKTGDNDDDEEDQAFSKLGLEMADKRGAAAGESLRKDLGEIYQAVKATVDGALNKSSAGEPSGPEKEIGPKMK